ncbi:MAG: DUF1844 domain-containing protein [Elusimicrobiota bacterium]
MAEEIKESANFITLILSLSTAAMNQLGKIPSPLTGKIERSLEQAKLTIDMLEMIKDKTRGNLTPREERLLSNSLADLQLNYVDELNKSSETGKEEVKKEELKH